MKWVALTSVCVKFKVVRYFVLSEYNELKTELSDFLKGFAQQGKVSLFTATVLYTLMKIEILHKGRALFKAKDCVHSTTCSLYCKYCAFYQSLLLHWLCRLCPREILMTSLRRCRLGNGGGWTLGREFPLKTVTTDQTTK